MKQQLTFCGGKIFMETVTPIKIFRTCMYCPLRMAFCFIFLQLVVTKNYGQQSNYIPETPTAAQYEKYITYPVDHSTGAASVTVPLYTIKGAGIEVPVNLSYHTSGVKPSDPSLPVGLGWVINPGARVTRKILGYPDETMPKPPVLKLAEELSPTADLQYLQNLEYGTPPPSSSYTDRYDPDYDIFTYYTGTGITGKFVIKKEGTEYIAIPLIATLDKIKLYTATNLGATSISYFEITDANGIYYRFGNPLTSYSSVILTESMSGSAVSSWLLTDIISTDQAETINFKWTNVKNDVSNYYKQQGASNQVIITDQYSNGVSPYPGDSGHEIGYNDVPQHSYQPTQSYFLSTVIAGIRYKNEEVKFNYTSGILTMLENMEVYSNGVKFRQVDFHRSSFSNTSYLKLDYVSIRDKNDQEVKCYRFGYNETSSFPAWPHLQLDFWGYFNGQISNTTLLPNFSYQTFPWSSSPYNYQISTSSRAAFSGDAQTYILNRITYPTGGKTTYEYESNMINNGGTVTAAGGLRVKKISHWAADGQVAETRSYEYGTNGGGSGPSINPSWYVKTVWICVAQAGLASFPIYRKRVITSEPNERTFIDDYPSVTYPTVTEYIGDANGSNSGKIVYNYSQPPLSRFHSFLHSYDLYGHWGRYWDNPRLEKTTYYKNNQGTYMPVRYTSTIYNTPSVDAIKSIIVRREAYFEQYGAGLQSPMEYEQHFYNYYPSLSSVFQYGTVSFNYGGPVPGITRNVEYAASGDSIVTIQNYNYANNDYRYVKSLSAQNSNGATTTTHYTYPKDYDVGNSPTNSVAQGIKLLKDRNVLAPVIEEYTEVQPGNVIKSGKFTTFKTDKPLTENIFSLNTIASAGTFSPATITSSSHTKSSAYLLKGTFDLYDQFGNLRQVTDDKGISTVILYSYGGKLPIAIIKNATYTSVTAVKSDALINEFASGYPTDTEVNNFLSSLRSSLSLAFITTYTHDVVFGMTSQTDENGRTSYYVYDAAGRLQLVKDKDGNIVKTFDYKYKQ
jgi:YD repeat-containing protein